MKTSKLYILLLSTLAFASCTKEMTEGLDEVNVSVVTSETVTAEGSIITVKKGTPVEFSFAGEPDFITFYSGELGHQYIYRQRVENEESDIVSSKLKFNIYQEGTSYAESTGRYTNCIDVFYAFSDPENGVEGFPGLSKDNFDADSTLVVDFWKAGKWKEICPKAEYDNLGTNITVAKSCEWDVKDFVGKNLVIAIAYNKEGRPNPSVNGKNATTQLKYYFDSMNIENLLRNNNVTHQYAGEFMFTALNFNHENLYNQSIKDDDKGYKGNDWTSVSSYLPDDLAYGTVTANVSGMWNMNNVANGGFYIHSTGSAYSWKTAWLVSDPIKITSCEPDQGVSIKNLSQDIRSYSYTYENVGTYRATFLITNANYKHDDSQVYTVVVNVTD